MKCWRTAWAVLLFVGRLSVAQDALSGSDFKAILANPPGAYELQFEIDYFSGPKDALKGMWVKSEPGRLLAKGYVNEADLAEGRALFHGRFLGELNGVIWAFEDNAKFVHVYDEKEQPPGNYPRHALEQHQHLKRYYIGNVLNAGVPTLLPGTIKWNGDEFGAYNAETDSKVTGHLAYSNGIPWSVVFTIEQKERPLREFRTVMAGWGPSTVPYPAEIFVEERVKGDWRRQKCIRIKRFQPGSESANPEIFSYSHYLEPQRQKIISEIGGIRYVLSNDGKRKTKVLEQENGRAAIARPKFLGRYLILSFLVAGAAAWALCRKKNLVQSLKN